MSKFMLGLLLGLALAVTAATFDAITANSYANIADTPVKRFVAGTDTCYYIIANSGVAISCK